MPELPEVEHVRRSLSRAVLHRRLEEVTFARADLRWPIPTRKIRDLRGCELQRVERLGKYLLLHFAGGRWTPLIHLGMSGRVLSADRAAAPAWETHEHWRMQFEELVVRYVDPRRFGALLAAPASAIERHPLLAKIGPDPLSRDFEASYLHALARNRRTTLKSFLLDGRNVAGVGNIYACEACFEAQILPQTRVHRISRGAWDRIHAAVRVVLKRALAAGGTTLRDFRDADGKPGYFQVELRVYGREGQPCVRCAEPVQVIRQAGRSTFFCRGCQTRTPGRK